jgi:hypothetical protein
MEAEPRDWDALAGKYIWPDRVLYQLRESGETSAIFVYNRGNNRALAIEKTMMLHLLESLGQKVMISSNGILLTLAEFNSGQGYMTGLTTNSKQYILNMRYEVKRLEMQLLTLAPTHPAYIKLSEQLALKRKMLEAVPITTTPVDVPEDERKAEQERRLKEWAEKGRQLRETDQISRQLEEIEKEADADKSD